MSHEKNIILSTFKKHFGDYCESVALKNWDFDINKKLIEIIKPGKENEFADNRSFLNYLINKYTPVETQSTLYRYVNDSTAEKTLQQGKIRLYHLKKYIINKTDINEYSFIPNLFDLELPELEKIPKDIFVLCLTTLENSEQHWKEYSKNKDGTSGTCLTVKITLKNNTGVEMRRVCYEDSLEPLKNLLADIKNLGYKLNSPNFHRFSKFTKTQKYKWENEVRLCLDHGLRESSNIVRKMFIRNRPQLRPFPINTDSKGFKFIELDLDNKFFKFEIINHTH